MKLIWLAGYFYFILMALFWGRPLTWKQDIVFCLIAIAWPVAAPICMWCIHKGYIK